MKFKNGVEKNNDFIKAVLMGAENAKLNLFERRRLYKLNKSYGNMIINDTPGIIYNLFLEEFARPLNHIRVANDLGETHDPDENEPYRILLLPKGLDLLNSNILESEHTYREWKRWQRYVSFWGAIIGTIISIGLLILKLIEWLSK